MIVIPSQCLVVYEPDDTGLAVQDALLVGELIEVQVKGEPEPIIGTLHYISSDHVVWIDKSKGYCAGLVDIPSNDILAAYRKRNKLDIQGGNTNA